MNNRILIWSIISIIILFILVALYNLTTQETINITILKMERITEYRDSKYLIYTNDEVFQNTDIITFGKFNSSDLYGKLEIGKSYKVRVCGKRIQLLSMYRNIINIE